MPAPDAPRSGGVDRWDVVLPVKGGPAAKSRLGGDAALRGRLALAMALDCLDVVLAAPGVARALVVTDDPAVAGAVAAAGARVVAPGPASARASALDDAVRAGARAAERCRPVPPDGAGGAGTGVAVLLPDVPALRAQEMGAALAGASEALAAGASAALVPDAAGRGTALLAARTADDLPVAYGEGSAGRHAGAGAAVLDLALPGLRRDVDTRADLREAVALGVGPRTADALARGRLHLAV
ncbi:2-phospho-L-lactate guanylyltransferase [Pseudokineococcus sp. 5B2Z-1]|uniref:2-phospho-L-lactate guanylyltransferase n=1 Tax=Pseudokineococcus sp. 5B2Z-1 TaxID=3132744 RepID=UPI0030B3273F